MTVILDRILAMEVSYLNPQWKKYIILDSNFIHLTFNVRPNIFRQEISCVFQTQIYITGTIGNQFVYVRYQLTLNVRIN